MTSINIEENFEIEDLGVLEEWVYDIEVENNHNFFGNNILIHNSAYLHIEPFMELYQKQNPNLSINEYVDWADSFEEKVIQPIIQKTVDDFSEELNAYNKEKIWAEREIIADIMIQSAKKKYFARVRDSEGNRYPENEPYIKKMGLEVIKSGTPKWVKKKLEEAIPHIFDKSELELKNWLQTTKEDFIKADLNSIASVGSISNLNYNLTDKGIPFGSRSAIIYNNYIKENNLEGKYNLIQAGDKCKRLFLRTPNKFNSEIISYTNDNFVEEIKDIIDYDVTFEKSFLKPLQLMVESLNYDLMKQTESLDEW